MNCPSRNESPLSHPEWNQSPTPLTADLTTNQDLNGLVNARARSGSNAGGNGNGIGDGSGNGGGGGDPRLLAGRSGVGGDVKGRGDGDVGEGMRRGEEEEEGREERLSGGYVAADPTTASGGLHHRNNYHQQQDHDKDNSGAARSPPPSSTTSTPHPHPVTAAQIDTIDRAVRFESDTDDDVKKVPETEIDSKIDDEEITTAEITQTGHRRRGSVGAVSGVGSGSGSGSGDGHGSLKDRVKSWMPKKTTFGNEFQNDYVPPRSGPNDARKPHGFGEWAVYCMKILWKFARFIGPGFIVAVSYIDPGNYATAVQAGAEAQYHLLFMTLVSNIIAIFLQSLCVKLGTVTGLNLAEMCRLHLPRWLTYILYVLAELAIIATDVSEVVGAVIAWNLLCGIPLVAGCFITLAEVFLTLVLYRPNGSMMVLRVFEYFVMALVLGVVVCFCVQLSLIKDTSAGQVFKGYLPSHWIVDGNGIYLSCGILGATVMPHSLFLGSGIVQSRLKDYDVKHHYIDEKVEFGSIGGSEVKYRPSLLAIRSCLNYSICELSICLFTFALFVNSAILIVAGAFLFQNEEAGDADLFGIYNLMRDTISKGAATTFAIALLLSGISAGMVCTISGQFISEGMLNWKMKPWIRRVTTRGISVIPAVIISAAVGRSGMNTTLTACQVVLSAILPFVSAPLLYFTGRNKFMTVRTNDAGTRTFPLPQPVDRAGSVSSSQEGASTGVQVRPAPGRQDSVATYETEYDDDATLNAGDGTRYVGMRNHPLVSTLAFLLWVVVVVMNVANIVLVGLGKA
ncbi:Natural resistance-associated macrophage protein [Ascosphaera apis ARSEF 7405]|uniref:Natural resistance-associated macrophage protein n=1 Tax=Ascosphaera apis ARSEF 7405 TaxID=392613 RepID=A0A162IMM9_9EURO|nr:Natural resistance-associated macrophage protein [Ascosphaera apis ARSEF 7405]